MRRALFIKLRLRLAVPDVWHLEGRSASSLEIANIHEGTVHGTRMQSQTTGGYTRRHSLTDRMSHGHSILQCFTAGDSVITTSFTGVKSCKYQDNTERASRAPEVTTDPGVWVSHVQSRRLIQDSVTGLPLYLKS